MKTKILVGAREFMTCLRERSQHAQSSLYIQAMTFEGDSAGEELIDLMIASPAEDKRLLIDSFSKVVVSDSFVCSSRYLKDSRFRKEIANGRSLIRKAEANGIAVSYTNPVGVLMHKYPLRNHKKMMIVDEEVAFLGGINFSEHNFGWHDMMVELEDSSVAKCLADDFRFTWLGQNQTRLFEFNDSSLWFFNGVKSKELYNSFFDRIKRANKSITIISPYVSDPLLEVIRSVASSIKITVIAPEENNKSLLKKNLLAEASKGYFDLLHYPGMFHLKAILIDDETLIFGSSNYDLISYYFEQEVVFATKDSRLVSDFTRLILEPMQRTTFEPVTGQDLDLLSAVGTMLLPSLCNFGSKLLGTS